MDDKENNAGKNGWDQWSAGVSLAAAFIVLAGFAYFANEMVELAKKTTDENLQWSRLYQIYNSIEAIAFGAAGLLFGTTIQRSRVREAENRADSAQRAVADVSAKGKTLARRITRFRASSTTRGLESATEELTDAQRAMLRDSSEVEDLARDFFPGS